MMFFSNRSIKFFLLTASASASLLLSSSTGVGVVEAAASGRERKLKQSKNTPSVFPFTFVLNGVSDLSPAAGDINFSLGLNAFTGQPTLTGAVVVRNGKLFLPSDIDASMPNDIDLSLSVGFFSSVCTITEGTITGVNVDTRKASCAFTACRTSTGDCFYATSGGSVEGPEVTGILTGGTGNFAGLTGSFTVPVPMDFDPTNPVQPGEQFEVADFVVTVTGLSGPPAPGNMMA